MKFGAGISSGLSNVLGFALTGLGFAATGGALGACGIGMAAFTGGGLLAKHVLDDRRADFDKQITSMCKRMEDELRLDARIADENNQNGLTALLNSLPGHISALGLTAEDIVAQGYNTNAIAGDLLRRLSEKDTAYTSDTFIGASTHKILMAAFNSVKEADEFVKQTTLACREKILADLNTIKKSQADRQADADRKHDEAMKKSAETNDDVKKLVFLVENLFDSHFNRNQQGVQDKILLDEIRRELGNYGAPKDLETSGMANFLKIFREENFIAKNVVKNINGIDRSE